MQNILTRIEDLGVDADVLALRLGWKIVWTLRYVATI